LSIIPEDVPVDTSGATRIDVDPGQVVGRDVAASAVARVECHPLAVRAELVQLAQHHLAVAADEDMTFELGRIVVDARNLAKLGRGRVFVHERNDGDISRFDVAAIDRVCRASLVAQVSADPFAVLHYKRGGVIRNQSNGRTDREDANLYQTSHLFTSCYAA